MDSQPVDICRFSAPAGNENIIGTEEGKGLSVGRR